MSCVSLTLKHSRLALSGGAQRERPVTPPPQLRGQKEACRLSCSGAAFRRRRPSLRCFAPSRRAMEFPATAYSAATRTLPAMFAAWGTLSQPARASLNGAMADRMLLVLVEGSQLAAAAPDLPFAIIDSKKSLPLHEIIFFYGRLL